MKNVNKKYTIPVGVGVGLLVSIGITLIVSCGLSILIHSERLTESLIGYGVLITLIISSVTGAATATSLIQEKRLVVSILSGTCYIITLLACTALFFDGQYQGVAVTALTIIGCTVASGLLGVNAGKKQHKKKYKIRNR